MIIEKQRQTRIKTHLNAKSFRSRIDSVITTNKFRLGVVVGIIGNEDFSIIVLVVVAMVFFFLFLRERKALEFGGFSLKKLKIKLF